MHSLGDAPASWAGVARLRPIHIEFVGHAVLPGVRTLVDVAVVANAAEQFLQPLLVALFRGADEVVVRDSHSLPKLTEFGGNFIGVLLRRFTGSRGGALNLLTMFVSASQEKSISAEQALPPRNRVAGDRGVGVTDVGSRIHVVDRGRNVKLSGHADVMVALGFCA